MNKIQFREIEQNLYVNIFTLEKRFYNRMFYNNIRDKFIIDYFFKLIEFIIKFRY